MKLLAGIAMLGLEAARDAVARRIEPTVNLHWAAYCGADAILRATQERERTAQSNKECMARELMAQREARAALQRKLDLLIQHSNKACLATWREACIEQMIELTEAER